MLCAVPQAARDAALSELEARSLELPAGLEITFARYHKIVVIELNDEGLYGFGQMAMMLRGELRQLATPAELVAKPADDYVAQLVAMARRQGEQLRELGGAAP